MAVSMKTLAGPRAQTNTKAGLRVMLEAFRLMSDPCLLQLRLLGGVCGSSGIDDDSMTPDSYRAAASSLGYTTRKARWRTSKPTPLKTCFIPVWPR